MRGVVATLICAFVGALVHARPADACFCPAPTLQQAFDSADLVFAGEALAQADTCHPGCYVLRDRWYGVVSTTFATTHVWKGSVAAIQTISERAYICDVQKYPVGESAVVFAYEISDAGYFTMGACGPWIDVDTAIEAFGDAGAPLAGDAGVWCPSDATSDEPVEYQPGYSCVRYDAGTSFADAGELLDAARPADAGSIGDAGASMPDAGALVADAGHDVDAAGPIDADAGRHDGADSGQAPDAGGSIATRDAGMDDEEPRCSSAKVGGTTRWSSSILVVILLALRRRHRSDAPTDAGPQRRRTCPTMCGNCAAPPTSRNAAIGRARTAYPTLRPARACARLSASLSCSASSHCASRRRRGRARRCSPRRARTRSRTAGRR